MLETTVAIRIPAPLMQLGLDQNEIEQRISEWIVFSLFTEGRISSGKAARLLGMTRMKFLALLQSRGIAYINYTPDELAEEFASAESIEIQGPQFGLPKIGTVGILLKAKQLGWIPALRPEIERLRANGFSLSQAVIDAVLQRAGE